MTEEKKTFNFLKTFVKTEIDYCKLEKADVLDILNLIEKLKKENKILKEENYNIERKYQDYRILSVGITQLELLIREARVISEAEERDEKTKEYYKTRLKCLLDLYSELYNSKTILDYIPKGKIREVKQYIEYYLIGNLKYENCQDEFKKILKLLEEE